MRFPTPPNRSQNRLAATARLKAQIEEDKKEARRLKNEARMGKISSSRLPATEFVSDPNSKRRELTQGAVPHYTEPITKQMEAERVIPSYHVGMTRSRVTQQPSPTWYGSLSPVTTSCCSSSSVTSAAAPVSSAAPVVEAPVASSPVAVSSPPAAIVTSSSVSISSAAPVQTTLSTIAVASVATTQWPPLATLQSK